MGERRTMSIKNTIITVFVLIMVIAASVIAYFIFSRWYNSAEATVVRISDSINNHIHEQIVSFMTEPVSINEANHKLFRDDILDIDDVKRRERYFVGALSSFGDEIYSFSYGSADGEYHGARRNESQGVEIMRNDASTGGASWYYSVTDDLNAKDLVVKLGPFDPRTRAWYQAAVQAGGIAFSPPYKHFVMDDLTISVSIPVFGRSGELKGVLGTHMLLAKIGDFLAKTVSSYDGIAIIVERESGYLIANSMGKRNFTTDGEGTLTRLHFDHLGIPALARMFEQFTASTEFQSLAMHEHANLHATARGFQVEGVDWVIISAISGSFLLNQVRDSITLTAMLILFAIILLVGIYHVLTTHFFKPIEDLLKVSASLSAGDLSKRVQVVRNDEIGRISSSLNDVADNLQRLFDNLETNVQIRTSQLHEANRELGANRDQLFLILNSAAEGIYGIDREGWCTFCNRSALRLLGYQREDELLGEDMHELIHHTQENGEPFPLEMCKIYHSIQDGRGYEAEDESFWRKDGTAFPVAYHAFPQIREGMVLGGVITFSDITERKQREQEIEYLRCHDLLTGLHNRRCFEEHVPGIDVLDNLPLSIVFADVNALKMTNDIFGHAAGDELIKKSAAILKESTRGHGIVARFGGDEFVMILPHTTREEAQAISERIRSSFSQERISAMRCSISLGIATKEHARQVLSDIMANAENEMYKDKSANRCTVNREIIETLQESLYSRSPREESHAKSVRNLALAFGAELDLSQTEISALERSACLHDIGKITLDSDLLEATELDEGELERIRQHPVIGYRILNLFDDTLDLAEYVYSHHEKWDGSGYPRGLKQDQIPFISRILSIVEAYDRILSTGRERHEAFDELRAGAGKQFDPHLVPVFVHMMERR